MARKHDLRLSRAGTILNLTSSDQESALGQALKVVVARLIEDFSVNLVHDKTWKLTEIVEKLRLEFADVTFADPGPKSYMSPDGGILSLVDREGGKHPILIAEVKNQGTNDLRATEGLRAQAKGNAIERLGKNVIGFRTVMLTESIMPFVCFGYGIDFDEGSSILDRVVTIAMFGKLNELHVMNEGDDSRFNRGSFFFRRPAWTEQEMETVMYEIASRSIHYYFAKHGVSHFREAD